MFTELKVNNNDYYSERPYPIKAYNQPPYGSSSYKPVEAVSMNGVPLSIPQLFNVQQVKPIGTYSVLMNGQPTQGLLGQHFPVKGDTNSENGQKIVKLSVAIPPAKKENVDKFNVNSKPASPIKLSAVKKPKTTTDTD
jgi:hypothetical protein